MIKNAWSYTSTAPIAFMAWAAKYEVGETGYYKY